MQKAYKNAWLRQFQMHAYWPNYSYSIPARHYSPLNLDQSQALTHVRQHTARYCERWRSGERRFPARVFQDFYDVCLRFQYYNFT